MDHDQRRALAEQMTERAEEVREKLSAVLRDMGFEDLEITEFKAAPREDQAATFKAPDNLAAEAFFVGAARCPTVCVVTPSGAIRCFPRC